MRIAILGTRGIPANYGGFETFAEELSSRLVKRGHQVSVYCRQQYEKPVYKGVRLISLPTISHKYFDTLAHTFLSTLHLLFHRVDAALYCNAANALFTIFPRSVGVPVALNVDGIERKRRKWNVLARTWYLVSERLATLLPNRIVTDAEAIREYYRTNYHADSVFIPYGADVEREPTKDVLDQLGLESGCYFLYVSRLEPENRALEVREAFEQVETPLKLALIGDAPYAEEYIARVRETKDPRIVIPGAIYGRGYRELGSWCFAYIHATEIGGTHPALIEAMGRGALVIYFDTIENREVCGDAGLAYSNDDVLVERIRQTLAMTEDERDAFRARAVDRIRKKYDWDVVTSQYEQLLLSLI